MSTLREMGVLMALENETIPDCVLDENLDSYFMHPVSASDYVRVVYALYFFSGPQDNPSAKSYVFYFYKDDKVNAYAKPDNIMTFKVRFKYPDCIWMIDQYLGGSAYGVLNAPPLDERGEWYPGWISDAGKKEIADIQAGRHFSDSISETTVRSHKFPDPEPAKKEIPEIKTEAKKEESSDTVSSTKVYAWIAVGALVLWILFKACSG